LLTTLGLTAGGLFAGTRLPSGIYPEIEFPRIVVVAREQDVPPQEAQKSLARPLENALATVMGVERIRSRTIRGSVELSLQFASGTDMWRALQMTESRVAEARASLPPAAEISVERLTTTSFPVVTFNLSGDIDSRRLRELGDLVVRPALSRIHGVGRIEVLGGDVREIEVVLDPQKVSGLRLRPADISDRLRDSTVLQAVGRFDESRELVTVMASAEPRTLADIEQIPIATAPDGTPVPLSAIARVFDGAEDRLLRVSGPRGETVLISVSRLPGASTPDVVGRAIAVVEDVATRFPSGVRLEPVYDQAALVTESMRSVRDAILIGIALCVLVIALFLRDVRAGLVAALAIPTTMAMSLLCAAAFGQSLNLMSLGGLAVAIGLIIDDAIVVVESIGRRLEEGEAAADAAVSGPRALFAALLGTTATTVVVLLPLIWLQGLVGHFFTALAIMLGSAVILSLLVSLTLVPMLSARWLRPTAVRRRRRIPELYGGLLRRGLRWPGFLLGGAVALLTLGGVALRYVPRGFLPTMDEGAFVLDYFLPASTSLNETDAVARKIETVLRANGDVQTYSRRTGAELGPIAATQVSRGDFMIRLKPVPARKHDVEEVISAVRAAVSRDVPEARTEFVQVLQDVLNDLSGAPRPMEIKVFGEDYAVLKGVAVEISRRIRDVPGLVDLYPGFEDESPELRFRVDPTQAGRFGRTATDLAADLETSLRGTIAAVFRRPDRPVNVRVRYPDEIRFDPGAVANLSLAWGPTGAIAVSALAPLERVGAPTVLLRENLRGVVIVTADHEERELGAVMGDVQRRLRGLVLPEGYSLEFGGQYAMERRAFSDLGIVLGFGLLAVLVVLAAQFRSLRHGLLVLGTAPLSMVGALLTLWITGVALNASSLMGCVLLVGLVVKNGILLVEHFESSREKGLSIDEALTHAGSERVRPILMTTIATLAGLGPLAFGIGTGSEIQRPLAIAVVGGLSVSIVVSLLVLPAMVRLSWRKSA
jgi:CzcA family heavy metal efflux pump